MQPIFRKWLTRWMLFVIIFIVSAPSVVIPVVVFIMLLRHLSRLKPLQAALMGGISAFIFMLPLYLIERGCNFAEPQTYFDFIGGWYGIFYGGLLKFLTPLSVVLPYISPVSPLYALVFLYFMWNWAIYGALASIIAGRMRKTRS